MYKKFVEIVDTKQKPKQIGDYLYQNYCVMVSENWDNFILDNLYKLAQEQGIDKILYVSKNDFKQFLIWAKPRYDAEVELNKDELINEIKYKLIDRERYNLKDIEDVCQYILPMLDNFTLKRIREVL